MGQQLALSREVSESSLLAVLKALEIQKTLGTEPVLTALRRFPAQPAQYADFPADLDPRLLAVLQARGLQRLYTHQREAFDAAAAGRDTVVVTPTASGKTLCYNLPVLDDLKEARAGPLPVPQRPLRRTARRAVRVIEGIGATSALHPTR